MTRDELLNLAENTFAAIENNTGTRYWNREEGLYKAAAGSGLTHLSFAYWLNEALTAVSLSGAGLCESLDLSQHQSAIRGIN